MTSAWQRYVDAVTSISTLSRHRAEMVVRNLVRQGEVAADQVERSVDDLLARSEQNRKLFAALVRAETERAVSRLGVASQHDIDRLATRLERLEARQARGGTGGNRPPTTKTAAASKTSASAKRAAAAQRASSAPAADVAEPPAQIDQTARKAARKDAPLRNDATVSRTARKSPSTGARGQTATAKTAGGRTAATKKRRPPLAAGDSATAGAPESPATAGAPESPPEAST